MTAALGLLMLLLGSVSAQLSPLIETHELNAKLQRAEALVILEVINLGETRDALLEPRIPLAQYLPLKSLLSVSGRVVKAPSLPAFKNTMKQLGVRKDGPLVVVYDCRGMKAAAMAWWLLRAYGKSNVQVLNGGLPKWLREGFMQARGQLPALLNPTMESDLLYQYVLDAGKYWSSEDLRRYEQRLLTTAQVVDVRPRSEFDLSNIRGSLSMPSDIISRADGTLRSEIELRAIFEGYKVALTSDIQTVAVSENGVAAAEVLLALGTLGKGNCVLVNGGWIAFQLETAPVVLIQGSSEVQCERKCAAECPMSAGAGCFSPCLRECVVCNESCVQDCSASPSSDCLETCYLSRCESSYLSYLWVSFLLLTLLLLIFKCVFRLRKPSHIH